MRRTTRISEHQATHGVAVGYGIYYDNRFVLSSLQTSISSHTQYNELAIRVARSEMANNRHSFKTVKLQVYGSSIAGTIHYNRYSTPSGGNHGES